MTDRGVQVDDRGRTAVRTVYAAGDAAGRRYLTNSAGYEAVRAVRDMFFPGKGSVDAAIPSCVFSDPELASVGLTVDQAEEQYGTDSDSWRIDLAHNDRARTDAHAEGAVVVVTAKGRIVGAHMLAPGAGEMIHELSLAIHRELRLDELAEAVHVYPTRRRCHRPAGHRVGLREGASPALDDEAPLAPLSRFAVSVTELVEAIDVAQLREREPPHAHDSDGRHAATDHRRRRADRLRDQAALERAQFVGRADEHVLDRHHAAALLVGRDQRNERAADVHAHHVGAGEDHQRDERQPVRCA